MGQHVPMDCNSLLVEPSEKELDMDKVKDIVLQTMKEKRTEGCSTEKANEVTAPSCSENHISDNVTTKVTTSAADPHATKPLRKKAKLMRMERKAEKLASAKKSSADVPEKEPSSADVSKKEPKNVQKTLAMLLNEVQDNCRHKLEVWICLCNPKCPDNRTFLAGKTSNVR